MRVARNAIGFHSYYWTNTKVLRVCGWMDAIHLVYYSTIFLFINVISRGYQNLLLIDGCIVIELHKGGL